MSTIRLFTQHPRNVGESYLEHCYQAMAIGCRLTLAAMTCFIHAVLPFLFDHTGSKLISDLHQDLQRRQRHCNADTNKATNSRPPPL